MMLSRVKISDFALIEQASLYPGSGFTVISGETGAGKSILIDAIGALTGERISKDFVRTGADRAVLEAVFLEESEEPADETKDPEEIFLERVIYAKGGTECRLDGHLVKLSDMKQLGEQLVSIHGQQDSQIIFREKEHLDLLDAYGRDEIGPLLAVYEDLRGRWLDSGKALANLGKDPQERERRLEILRYQYDEILAAGLHAGEEEELKQRAKILGARERILRDLGEAHQILGQDDENSAGTLLEKTQEILEFSSRYSQKIRSSREELQKLTADLIEIKSNLEDFSRRLDIDDGELPLVRDRLDLINELKRKYGSSEEEILAFKAETEAEIKRLESGEADFHKLSLEQEKLAAELEAAAANIHALRLKSAKELDAGISAELRDLDMPNVRFETIVKSHTAEAAQQSDTLREQPDLREPRPEAKSKPSDWPKNGTDSVAFMISPNIGEPLKPLAQIASSGEASRVLLAVKTVLAAVDKIPVLIFDEIDSGISGKTTGSIALKLQSIAESCQVLCVTHSAQIAARAGTHYLISKKVKSGRTSTELVLLEGESRVDEIARLLSGEPEDKVTRELARQLLSQA
ncbi:MAG: DNA repair protein RecN [Clostridiaceae bacterium]|nr:DNA repair protein RecN [Clostridiaceae bacterium]